MEPGATWRATRVRFLDTKTRPPGLFFISVDTSGSDGIEHLAKLVTAHIIVKCRPEISTQESAALKTNNTF